MMQLKILNPAAPPPQDRDQPWYAQGLSFSCTCSGNCCTGGPGFVWLSEEELNRLADHLALSREETLKKYCRKIGRRISLKERKVAKGQYDCIFLQEIEVIAQPDDGSHASAPPEPKRKRICAIYPVRPLQCRTWPFWDVNLESPVAWKKAARTCPGMNRGQNFTKGQIQSLRDATDWPDKAPTSDAE